MNQYTFCFYIDQLNDLINAIVTVGVTSMPLENSEFCPIGLTLGITILQCALPLKIRLRKSARAYGGDTVGIRVVLMERYWN